MHRILIHASAHVVSHYAASVLTEILNSNECNNYYERCLLNMQLGSALESGQRSLEWSNPIRHTSTT